MVCPEYRSAVRNLLESFEAQWFLTANFNGPADLVSGRSALRGFHARIDRRLLGRNWAKQPADTRSSALWVPEHLDSNLHWHGLLKLPVGDHQTVIEELPEMWTRIVPSG